MKKCSYCDAEYPDNAVICTYDNTPLEGPVKKHSGLGIASFIISAASGFFMMVVICLAGFLSAHRIPGERTYPGQSFIGLLIIFLGGLDVVAVGLGIAALCQSEKNRLFGILGLVFSSLTILGVIGLMIVGMMFMSRFAR